MFDVKTAKQECLVDAVLNIFVIKNNSKRKTTRPHCKKRRFSAAYFMTFDRKAL